MILLMTGEVNTSTNAIIVMIHSDGQSFQICPQQDMIVE